MIEYLGWSATAVFVASYFCSPSALKRVQMLGASMWVVYGLLIGASPVVAANVLVFGAAALTLARARGELETQASALRESQNDDAFGGMALGGEMCDEPGDHVQRGRESGFVLRNRREK